MWDSLLLLASLIASCSAAALRLPCPESQFYAARAQLCLPLTLCRLTETEVVRPTASSDRTCVPRPICADSHEVQCQAAPVPHCSCVVSARARKAMLDRGKREDDDDLVPDDSDDDSCMRRWKEIER